MAEPGLGFWSGMSSQTVSTVKLEIEFSFLLYIYSFIMLPSLHRADADATKISSFDRRVVVGRVDYASDSCVVLLSTMS